MNSRTTGPGPLRTARGAGRRAEADFFAAGFFLVVVLRERELAVFFAPEREEEVVLLRDAGGEDVRVAMTPNLGDRPTRPRDNTRERAPPLAVVPPAPPVSRVTPGTRDDLLRLDKEGGCLPQNPWTCRIPAP
ncbi:hypothetical protein NSI01_17760 [Pimelobacter simplex]|nr:hypothetical protein NSI01_17760 [Pimelobacter simplex]